MPTNKRATTEIRDILEQGFRTSQVISFLIIPYLLVLQIGQWWKKNGHERNGLPSLNITATLVQLIANQVGRLAHANDVKDPAVAVASGLTKVVDQSLLHRFVRSFTREEVDDLMTALSQRMTVLGGIIGRIVNVDTHNTRYFGEKDLKKTMIDDEIHRAVITAFFQDQETGNIIYATNDFRGKTYSEFLLFVAEKVKEIVGKLPEYLVFDLGFYKGAIFAEIQRQGMKFLTLLKRYEPAKKIIAQKLRENEFQEVKVRLPTREKVKVEAIDTTHRGGVKGFRFKYRLVIVRWPGNEKDVVLFTNDFDLSTAEVIEMYARRWRIEIWFDEAITSHALDRLTSSDLLANDVMNVMRLVVADALRLFMTDVGRDYRNAYPVTFMREVVDDLRAEVKLDGDTIRVELEPSPHLKLIRPMFENIEELMKGMGIDPRIPWMDNLKLSFELPQV